MEGLIKTEEGSKQICGISQEAFNGLVSRFLLRILNAGDQIRLSTNPELKLRVDQEALKRSQRSK